MRERVIFEPGFILTVLVFLFFFGVVKSSPVKAYEAPPVVINEIAWMGTSVSANDEWIELKNTTSEEIALTGWSLSWGSTVINLTGSISASGYFLLERTDDDTVPGVVADQIYTGSLSNTGSDLVLKNDLAQSVDSAVFDLWPAGDNTTKQTMERVCPVVDGNLTSAWQNSELAQGTPRAINFGCEVLVCEPIELNRVCQSDGQAMVEYYYTNLACGENFTQIEVDNSCACVYSAWQDSACINSVQREQTRTESSGFLYCTEDLVRTVDDETCSAEAEYIWRAKGKGCIWQNNRWICGQTQAFLLSNGEMNLTVVGNNDSVSKTINLQNKIVKPKIAVYTKKNNPRHLQVVWHKIKQTVLVVGWGVWFQGKVD